MTEKPSSPFPYIVGAAFNIRENTSPNASDTNTTEQPSTLHQLRITGTIATGPARRTQLFLCQISPGTTQTRNQVLAAKVWDPVYHSELDARRRRSPTELATLKYNNERTAFERIAASQSKAPYQCTPEYYGSWSLQCPEAPSATVGPSTRTRQKQKETPRIRTVPLIFMEHVQGCCMWDLDSRTSGPDRYYIERCDEGYRLAVWARILEIESWLDHIGVEHDDMETRNFMIDPAPNLPDPPTAEYITSLISLAQSKPRRVTIIDFDTSLFHSASDESKPQNPIDMYWSKEVLGLIDWIPTWWVGNLPKRREWLLEHFEGNTYFRRPLPDKSRERVNVLSRDDEISMSSYGFRPKKSDVDSRV